MKRVTDFLRNSLNESQEPTEPAPKYPIGFSWEDLRSDGVRKSVYTVRRMEFKEYKRGGQNSKHESKKQWVYYVAPKLWMDDRESKLWRSIPKRI